MSDDMNQIDAQRLAEAVGDHLAQVLNPLAKTIERMNERLDTVDRRVVFLEANHQRPEIESLRATVLKIESELETQVARESAERKTELAAIRADVSALMTWRYQMAGAATLFNWVSSKWAFLAMVAAALVAFARFGGGGGLK